MLDHLLVLTDDVEATRRFYCDVLGFEAGERPQLPCRAARNEVRGAFRRLFATDPNGLRIELNFP